MGESRPVPLTEKWFEAGREDREALRRSVRHIGLAVATAAGGFGAMAALLLSPLVAVILATMMGALLGVVGARAVRWRIAHIENISDWEGYLSHHTRRCLLHNTKRGTAVKTEKHRGEDGIGFTEGYQAGYREGLRKSPQGIREAHDKHIDTLRSVAREHGYALATHGSLMRDIDIVAVPWVEEVSDAETLAVALRNAVHGAFGSENETDARPHGRRVWAIKLPEFGATYFDLSVCPCRDTEAIVEGEDAMRRSGTAVETEKHCRNCKWSGMDMDMGPYCAHPKTRVTMPFGSYLTRRDPARDHCGPTYKSWEPGGKGGEGSG